MKTSKTPVSLSENDYLAVLDIIHQLHGCETRDHFESVLKEIIFPLFRIQSFGSSWIDFDLNKKMQGHGKLLVQLGYSMEEAEIWQEVYPYQKDITRLFATSFRPVLAFDVDIPRSNLKALLREFLDDHPQYDKPEFKSLHTITSLIALADPPDFNIGIGLTRFQPHEEPFTLWDVRMAELIRPSLIHALKFIAINEELQTVRSLVEHLSRVPTPLCLVHPQGLIAFCNEAFESLTNWKQGEFLPRDLITLLNEKEKTLADSKNAETPADPLAFYALPSGNVRCSWTLLKQPGDFKDGCWLLKMKPVMDPYSKIMLALEQAGLTPREREVAARIHDGLDDADIAGRLFISQNTLKNHLKNIYRKLDLHSRTQLVATLRPSAETWEV